MKLRNKKTGAIGNYSIILQRGEGDAKAPVRYGCGTLAKLNADWEDYKPKEPLIKDENKLDTVKSFFALLGITKEIYYQTINNCFYHTDDDGISYGIDFSDDKGFDNIDTDISYTIVELCGEADK